MKTLFEEIMSLDYSDAGQYEKNIVAEMNKAEIFHIQNVADYYWQLEQQYWDIEKDFPNLAPSFPAFWIEYSLPEKCGQLIWGI